MRLLMRVVAVSLFLTAVQSCKARDTAVIKSESDDTLDVDYLETIASESDFDKISITDTASGSKFVRYCYFYGLANPAFADKLLFQNMKRRPSHAQFLTEVIPEFRDVNNIAGLYIAPVEPEAPNPKILTCGALYIRKGVAYTGFDNSQQNGIAAYIVYTPSELKNNQMRSILNVDEISRFERKLRAALPVSESGALQAPNVAYLMAYPGDRFLYTQRLKTAGINSLMGTVFLPDATTVTTYSAATSYGFLTKVSDADMAAGNYSDKAIVILDHVPLDIGRTSGIITKQSQVPHSHVIFRAINQRVPDMFFPNIDGIDSIRNNIGKLVRFVANEDRSYSITSANEDPSITASAEAYWRDRDPAIDVPVPNLSVSTLFSWQQDPAALTADKVQSYGAKGTNFAFLDTALRAGPHAADREVFNNSFLIPFSMSAKHLAQPLKKKACEKAAAKCQEEVGAACSEQANLCQSLLNRPLTEYVNAMLAPAVRGKMQTDVAYRRAYLAFMRRIIRHTKLAPEVSDPIINLLKQKFPPNRRMRMRSSTNAEDLAGLTGAGLYESKPACLADEDFDEETAPAGTRSPCRTDFEVQRIIKRVADLRALKNPDGTPNLDAKNLADESEKDITSHWPVSDTIRKVFASLWTERAFMDRENHKMDHTHVYMGILVHPAFIDESANGVATITFKPDGTSECNIVVQVDDLSITNPEYPGAVPDQVVIVKSPAEQWGDPRYSMRSNRLPAGSTTVLSDAELRNLAEQVHITATALKAAAANPALNRYDVEFIRSKDHQILIKQGRPL